MEDVKEMLIDSNLSKIAKKHATHTLILMVCIKYLRNVIFENITIFILIANKIDGDTRLAKPLKETQVSSDICEAGKLRCKQLSEESTRCPYGLEYWINAVGCEDCRCSNPCLPGPDQKSVCPVDYQCIVESITMENGDQKYKPSCRPGIHLNHENCSTRVYDT